MGHRKFEVNIQSSCLNKGFDNGQYTKRHAPDRGVNAVKECGAISKVDTNRFLSQFNL
jgi:hypothetical protein